MAGVRTQRGKGALTARGWRYDYGAERVRVCEQRPCIDVLEIALGHTHSTYGCTRLSSTAGSTTPRLSPILPYSTQMRSHPTLTPKCAVPNAPSQMRRRPRAVG